MLTDYGKELRKIRIDRQELMKDMASRLGVSVAYLSAVETGKRKVPADWTSKILQHYNLSVEQANALRDAEDASIDQLQLRIRGASHNKREAALAFAKAFDDLSEEDAKKILTAVKALGSSRRK